MKRRRVRPPKVQEMILVAAALRHYIPSTEPHKELRRSQKGVPHLRYSAETNGIPWKVDIYLGQFYRAQVGTGIGDVQRSLPILLGYLHRCLFARKA